MRYIFMDFLFIAIRSRELHSYESYLDVIHSDYNYENKLCKKHSDVATYNITQFIFNSFGT
jgi:hypothetical protein